MKLTEFEALSFDCYGTLIDWESGIASVLTPWARRNGLDLDAETLLAAYAGHEARAETDQPESPYPDILRRSFAKLGEQLGLPVTAEDADRLALSIPDWPAFDDSHDSLRSLSNQFKLIILSNIDRESFVASNQRLDISFDSVLTAQDIGSYKPSSRNFDALVAESFRLGIGRGNLLHVAQSLFHDHIPAKQAGLPTVWINRRRGRPGWGATPAPGMDVRPDWEFPSMATLAAAAEAG